MCGIYGFLDTQRQLTLKQKNRLIKVLSYESEERGTDAAGIAYNHNGRTVIYKRPVAAHWARFRLPGDAIAVLGHTRMTTQGSAKNNFNNHPFTGKVDGSRFAFAHNGVVWNDKALSREESLPKTNIQTDSYVAVQLIEKENALSFDSLKYMSEKTQGTFVYTILDEHNNFWFVKGDNPIALYRFDNGLFVYASTEQILSRSLKRIGWNYKSCEQIQLKDGDILRITSDGDITRGSFTPSLRHSYSGYVWDDDFIYARTTFSRLRETELKDEILDCVRNMGVSELEIRLLLAAGYDAVDIGELVYDPELLHACLDEILCDRRMSDAPFVWQ